MSFTKELLKKQTKEQAGFRKGKSCIDQIAAARMFVEETSNGVHRLREGF